MNEAELLFSEILNCDRLSLYQNKNLSLDRNKSLLLACVLKRRITGEPIQYILGKSEFMGLEFRVDKNVLIPRPETEILVETVINLVHSSRLKVHSILDMGTGSGCIAVSLAKFIPGLIITAIDISEKAIEVARQNALLNNVKINFLVSDLFSNAELRTMHYELIISNPPYVATEEIKSLQPEIIYEPYIALNGGRDGLDFYRRIADSAFTYLKEGGLLVMEMGFGQNEQIENIFQKSKKFEIISTVKDYNNIDRVITVRKIKKNG